MDQEFLVPWGTDQGVAIPVASDPWVMQSVAFLALAIGLDSAAQPTWLLGATRHLVTDQPVDLASRNQLAECPDLHFK